MRSKKGLIDVVTSAKELSRAGGAEAESPEHAGDRAQGARRPGAERRAARRRSRGQRQRPSQQGGPSLTGGRRAPIDVEAHAITDRPGGCFARLHNASAKRIVGAEYRRCATSPRGPTRMTAPHASHRYRRSTRSISSASPSSRTMPRTHRHQAVAPELDAPLRDRMTPQLGQLHGRTSPTPGSRARQNLMSGPICRMPYLLSSIEHRRSGGVSTRPPPSLASEGPSSKLAATTTSDSPPENHPDEGIGAEGRQVTW